MAAFQTCLLAGVGLGLLLASGCQGGKQTPDQSADVEARQPEDKNMKARKTRQAADAFPGNTGAATPIPPGTCRLVGEIVAILPQRDQDKQAPCGLVPCRALVRIRRIVGYGAAFGGPLAEGQEIKAHFTFTLSPTGKFFPELTTPLPGLRVGSLFEADIPARPESGTRQEPWFQVTTYKAR